MQKAQGIFITDKSMHEEQGVLMGVANAQSTEAAPCAMHQAERTEDQKVEV